MSSLSDSENKIQFPNIRFYDQDFVEAYDQTWNWVEDCYSDEINIFGEFQKLFIAPGANTINSLDACFSTFFLVYSNTIYSSLPQLDFFYSRQEENGAIRSTYSLASTEPVFSDDNPESLGLPLFAWTEYNLYHKLGNKRRIREVMPILEAYFSWIANNFKDENGLYATPLAATGMINSPRNEARYFVDFNMVQAINALYMSELGDILNDKEITFRYKQHYFTLKTRINQKMWCEETGFYFDVDKHQNKLNVKTLAAYWSLIAELPNDAKFERLFSYLKDPNVFGTPNPFPSLAVNEPAFNKDGNAYCGSVFPHLTFMVIKGLEKYSGYEFARSASIRHLYYILDALHPEGNTQGNVYAAYKPTEEGPATWIDDKQGAVAMYLPYVGLSTISLMIENIIGLYISLPRKTVVWIVPTLENMGIENLSLKRNLITILSNKSNRGWEVRLESEKLYYFTIDILSKKRKTLPIPSGKCSILLDKL